MSRLVESISKVCREHLLAEKWLIAPSLRAGHQWLQSVARAGHPVVNVRVQTVKGMALELAATEMVRENLTLITATAGAFIVDSIWNRLPGKSKGYLSKLNRSPTLSQAVYGSINALRQADVNPDRLGPDDFEVAAKGKDLVFLVREYMRQLRARKLVDYADALHMAIARLRDDLFAIPDGVLVLVPEDAEPAGLEKKLINAIPAERMRSIAVDGFESQRGTATDLGLLSWVLNPSSAPEPRKDGAVTVFQAIGEANEAREVLRRCLASRHRLDEVEILHTDTATYVPLFYETAMRLLADQGPLDHGLPITFAEGIPVSYSRPGRALSTWLSWIHNDYPQVALVRMLHDGLLDVPGMKEAEFSFSGLAGLLRSIGIGFGRDRYIAKIEEQVAAVTKQLEVVRAAHDDDRELSAQHPRALERRLRGLHLLRELAGNLLDISQPPMAAPLGILETATRFLNELARCVSEQDNYARKVLLSNIDEMRRWSEQVGQDASLDYSSWLSALPGQLRILGSGPRPGCVHVAHALTGGHSGRPHTYIVGLDDSRFPGPTLQDPILLDTERGQLCPELPTAASRLKNSLVQFARMLARLRGTVTLSFSCRNLADNRETFPSSLLLSAFRVISGQRTGDQTALLKWLPPPASFAPDTPEKCLDEGEWWLWRLCSPEKVSGARELVLNRFPHLARGSVAGEQRESAGFTAFDGFVPAAGVDLDPLKPAGRPVSASAMEMLGGCPLAYFFRYALNVRPLDEIEVDLDRWLDPLAFGSLLHEVFRRFMTDLRSEAKLPDFKRDSKRIEHVLQEEISKYRDLYPPPNAGSYRDQCRQLERAVLIFLMEEEELCKTHLPTFMEACIGLPSDTGGTPLDHAEPVPVPLGKGKSIRVRGRIDRIDRVGHDNSNAFTIWDYKTGSSSRYRLRGPFRQGRLVQHTLYLALAQAVLRDKVDRKAIVQSFGYFFPSVRGNGQRLVWTPDRLAEGPAVVQRLCETVASGAFLATDNKDDCSYCDFQPVCGDIEAVTARSKEKLDAVDIVELKSFRELRRNG